MREYVNIRSVRSISVSTFELNAFLLRLLKRSKSQVQMF